MIAADSDLAQQAALSLDKDARKCDCDQPRYLHRKAIGTGAGAVEESGDIEG